MHLFNFKNSCLVTTELETERGLATCTEVILPPAGLEVASSMKVELRSLFSVNVLLTLNFTVLSPLPSYQRLLSSP